MIHLGSSLRDAARDLGLSDAEVARRAGLTERRYGHYVTGAREPDLSTLVRICTVLGITPNDLLGTGAGAPKPSAGDKLRTRLVSATELLGKAELELLVVEAEAIARFKRR